jgi:hypothetical protein
VRSHHDGMGSREIASRRREIARGRTAAACAKSQANGVRGTGKVGARRWRSWGCGREWGGGACLEPVHIVHEVLHAVDQTAVGPELHLRHHIFEGDELPDVWQAQEWSARATQSARMPPHEARRGALGGARAHLLRQDPRSAPQLDRGSPHGCDVATSRSECASSRNTWICHSQPARSRAGRSAPWIGADGNALARVLQHEGERVQPFRCEILRY